MMPGTIREAPANAEESGKGSDHQPDGNEANRDGRRDAHVGIPSGGTRAQHRDANRDHCDGE
jgi:hypothetical protein